MIKKFLSSEFGKGTLTLFVMMNIFNVINFLFHFSMGRLLGPVDYGTLAVLFSIVYIYSVPTEALQNIASKYTSLLNIKKENGKIKFFMIKTMKKGACIAGIFFIFTSIGGFFLARFLDINPWLIVLTNLILFSSFSVPIARGILQGRKKFNSLGISLIAESSLKLILAILFVYLGFAVFGAMIGVLIGIFFGVYVSIYLNKDTLMQQEEKVHFKEIYSRSIPYFVSMLSILLIFSLDILLAKRFFSAEIAGQYAVLSMIGKMIFLGTAGIGKAMFPLTSEKSDSNEDASNLFKKSFLITGVICFIAIGIFALLPKIIILVSYGQEYILVAPYLVYSGIAFSFLSLSNLILIYGLSTNKLKNSYLLVLFIILEIVLLYSFHNNIQEYIKAFMASNIVMFIGSFFLVKIWKK